MFGLTLLYAIWAKKEVMISERVSFIYSEEGQLGFINSFLTGGLHSDMSIVLVASGRNQNGWAMSLLTFTRTPVAFSKRKNSIYGKYVFINFLKFFCAYRTPHTQYLNSVGGGGGMDLLPNLLFSYLCNKQTFCTMTL